MWTSKLKPCVAFFLAGFVCLPAQAADIKMLDKLQTFNGIEYVCTGIGASSRENPAWQAYSLKVIFSTVEGDYVAWVDAEIRDAAGGLVLQASCPSPWLLAKLPPGKYRLTASKQGLKPHAARISVGGAGQAMVAVRFADLGES